MLLLNNVRIKHHGNVEINNALQMWQYVLSSINKYAELNATVLNQWRSLRILNSVTAFVR